jgi:anaphase-promoting complex subunit 10
MSLKVNTGQDIDPYRGEKEGKLREIGNQAVWSLSSCKPGFGVEQLRDGSLDTYWQSDGPQPHLINIQFRRKMTIHDICIYADYKADESYTPNRISIRVGAHFNDLTELEQIELNEPSGWVVIPLRESGPSDSDAGPVRAFMLQIAILSNHQNGRDTHMRHIKIHAPVQDTTGGARRQTTFTSTEMQQFACIR